MNIYFFIALDTLILACLFLLLDEGNINYGILGADFNPATTFDEVIEESINVMPGA